MDPMGSSRLVHDIVLDPQNDNFGKSLRSVVNSVVSSWGNLTDDDIEIKRLTGGLTNYLYVASTSKSSTTHCVLARIYGSQTELIIDRKKELENIARCCKNGFGPYLYGTFQNGYVYEYFEGRTIPPEELHRCVWNAQLGKELAKWHKQPLLPSETTSQVWSVIEEWLTHVPELYSTQEKQKNWLHIGGKGKIKEELTLLKKMAVESKSPVVLAHNDLLGGNIIANEQTGIIKFIDFEYACANYQAFDIANHFNEWAGFEADYSRYPKKDQQYQFYQTYLTEYNGGSPSEQELHTLYVQVNKFALVSHFYWGVWALVQGAISQIDFDFVAYAAQRFDEYDRRKEEFLNLV